MKIIATRNDSGYGHEPDTFIVEISIHEIKKIADKSGYQQWPGDETKKLLAPGATYDISAGYDFRNDILTATSAMKAGHEKFMLASKTMAAFVSLTQPKEPQA